MTCKDTHSGGEYFFPQAGYLKMSTHSMSHSECDEHFQTCNYCEYIGRWCTCTHTCSKPLFGPQASCHSAAYDDWQHLPLCKHKTMLILLMLLLLMMLLLLLMLTLMLMLILLLN